MKKLIKSLKNSHSECLSGLSNYIVKIGIDSLAYPMTHLFNECVESSTFPTKWKLMRILGLFKGKGNMDDPMNYRPIALTIHLSKTMERVLRMDIVKYFD